MDYICNIARRYTVHTISNNNTLLVEQVEHVLSRETCPIGDTCRGKKCKKCVFPVLSSSETKFYTFRRSRFCKKHIYEIYILKQQSYSIPKTAFFFLEHFWSHAFLIETEYFLRRDIKL